MIYQLPNGKVIHISLEEYLDLTDNDIQFLVSIDAGGYAPSPFYGSSIKNSRYIIKEEEDKSMDYEADDQDRSHGDNLELDDTILEEFPDIPLED